MVKYFNVPQDHTSECLVEPIAVSEASALILLFSKETILPEGVTLSIYSDESCKRGLITVYSGADSYPTLYPVTIPHSKCWVHITRPDGRPGKGVIKVIPIHPFLGLALWTIGLVSTSPGIHLFSATRDKSFVETKNELHFQFCYLISKNYNLLTAMASPLKQILLGKCAELLNRVCPSPKISSCIPSNCLAHLKSLFQEMIDLYITETQGIMCGIFTSYLQQLMTLLTISDTLRSKRKPFSAKNSLSS
eukprot:TRINITY_DN2837_c0_g1_i1.p1 TRINITY_DN2837_c0_g1~~TRINITY_DN2837_c0_g1_i1.p1  ORF type:complete len:276 (-),score=22.98 TRINITY_DN2837_c0_g1_i1:45-791(-)